jgi:hypothetical protein
VASGAESGTTVTIKSSAWADGGGVVLAYQGAGSSPITAVSALSTNDNNGDGTNTATFGSASWNGPTNVISLLLMSWQTTSATVVWPRGYSLQATANDAYSFVAVGANLSPQSTSNLTAQAVTLSNAEDVIPTLQVAVLVHS